jgi:hypothetical protein
MTSIATENLNHYQFFVRDIYITATSDCEPVHLSPEKVQMLLSNINFHEDQNPHLFPVEESVSVFSPPLFTESLFP